LEAEAEFGNVARSPTRLFQSWSIRCKYSFNRLACVIARGVFCVRWIFSQYFLPGALRGRIGETSKLMHE
jgi:hypothetical protein